MDIFKTRREQLMAQMPGGIGIVPGENLKARNADVDFSFRQNSDFYYLTGVDEPQCLLVLTPGSDAGDSHLFLRPKDPLRETWDGPMIGLDGAREDYGFDKAYPIASLKEELPKLMEGRTDVYFTPVSGSAITNDVLSAMGEHRSRPKRKTPGPDRLMDLRGPLHRARFLKSPEEVTWMRRAGEISAAGHREAMRLARPGLYEYQVQAGMEFVFRSLGSTRNGYGSIVASGRNATILHYVVNNACLKDGDLLLIDAGAEFEYYTADITRTFPVNGSFTSPQKDIYSVVLASQEAAIEASVIGATKDAIHALAVNRLSQGLIDLGILKGNLDEVIEKEDYKRFYMHGTGHWLGMDVHDVGLYYDGGEPVPYEEGTVTTVEPGLYFGFDDDIPEAYRGIGIRIEDDILTTRNGPVNLTSQVPTSIEEIETLCQEASSLAPLIPTLPN